MFLVKFSIHTYIHTDVLIFRPSHLLLLTVARSGSRGASGGPIRANSRRSSYSVQLCLQLDA